MADTNVELDQTTASTPTSDTIPDDDPAAIVFDGRKVGYVDHDGNIRLMSAHGREDRVIGHVANDREHAIGVLRKRYLQYVDQTRTWCEETRAAKDRLWRIHDCDRRLHEIDEQYVLGDFAEVRCLLDGLKAELLQEQTERIAQRTSLIGQAEELVDRTDWRDASQAFDDLNTAFKAIGTAGDRHQDTVQWDGFKELEREFRGRRKAHFDRLDQEFAARARAKMAICEAAESLQESTDFKTTGQRFRELLDEWKAIGFSGRDHDEVLWKRFQAERNVFAERRQLWFLQNAELKELLAVKAEALATMDDAAAAYQQMKPLMHQWREIGSAGRQADDALWARFQGAQEDVFQRSRAIFDARQRERESNYAAKQALVAEAESLVGHDSRTATRRCKELQQEWKKIGPVPREQNEQQWQRFRAACDSIFRIAEAEGKRRIQSARDRAEDQIRKLSAEIDEHERKIAHWEGVIENLRDGTNAEEIREGMEAKIATAKERIELKLRWIEEHYLRMTELKEKL